MDNIEKLTDLIAKQVRLYLNKSNIVPVGIIKTEKQTNATTNNVDGTYSGKTFQLLNKKLIIEDDIKQAMKDNCEVIEVNKKSIITPLAKDMILHKKLKLIKK